MLRPMWFCLLLPPLFKNLIHNFFKLWAAAGKVSLCRFPAAVKNLIQYRGCHTWLPVEYIGDNASCLLCSKYCHDQKNRKPIVGAVYFSSDRCFNNRLQKYRMLDMEFLPHPFFKDCCGGCGKA